MANKNGVELGKLLAKLTDRMKKDKRFELCVYGVLVLAGILIYAATTVPKSNAENTGAAETQSIVCSSERETEERLKSVLSCIRGAGKVEVMITYDTGAQIVPAMSTDTQTGITQSAESVTENRTESSRPVTVSQGGGNEALVLTEKQPIVRGVIVIAEGAADIAVRINLQNAVQTVLGIELSCIEVFEMKATEKED